MSKIMSDVSTVTKISECRISDIHEPNAFVVTKDDNALLIRVGIKGTGPAAQRERTILFNQVKMFKGKIVNIIIEEWLWESKNRSGVIRYLMSIEKSD